MQKFAPINPYLLHTAVLGHCVAICKAAYTFSECLAKQKRTCLDECTPYIRHSCTCISTDVHMWQRYTNSIRVCSSFVRNFLWHSLIYHWRMANKHDSNVFVHVCWEVHTWRMHTFACVWPNTFAECICVLRDHRTPKINVIFLLS